MSLVGITFFIRDRILIETRPTFHIYCIYLKNCGNSIMLENILCMVRNLIISNRDKSTLKLYTIFIIFKILFTISILVVINSLISASI